MQIRNATLEDEASCAALLDELGASSGISAEAGFGETFRLLVGMDRGQIIVAVEDGVVLGMATVSFNLALRYRGEYCQLEELIVSRGRARQESRWPARAGDNRRGAGKGLRRDGAVPAAKHRAQPPLLRQVWV